MSTSNNKDQEEIKKLIEADNTIRMTNEVAESIASNKLVLFIGAGFAMNLDMPDWKHLVNGLCTETGVSQKNMDILNNLMECGYYSGAIEKIPVLTNVQETTIKNFTSSRILVAFDRNNELHTQKLVENKVYGYLKELYECGARKIVTTNYDKSIETCLEISDQEILLPTSVSPTRNNIDYIGEIKKIREKIIKKDEYYIKLHGDADNEDSLVLSETDYRNHYVLNEQIPSLLQELFTHNRILFLGCGLDDRYMDVFEKLYINQTVMNSYVICKKEQHESVAGKTGIKRITIKDYIYLDDVLGMILEKTREIQQKKSKKILFSALPLENYDYSSSESFFSQVSKKKIKSCHYFNTQVEFSAWFSPALQIYLTQQMKAYSDHKNDGFKHYRIFFLPYNKSVFDSNLRDKKKPFKQNVKAMVKLHTYMECQPVFITTDMFEEIISKNQFFFSGNNLEALGMTGYPDKDLGSIIQEQSKNGYRKDQDLDFVVAKSDDEEQIWQANYKHNPNSKKFVFTNLKGSNKYNIYKDFSGMIIDYLKTHDDVFDPVLVLDKLSDHLKMSTDLRQFNKNKKHHVQ